MDWISTYLIKFFAFSLGGDKEFKFPKEVKVIGGYLLIGRHISVAIFEVPSEESILKITYPFGEIGIAHVAPALPLADALKMMEKM